MAIGANVSLAAAEAQIQARSAVLPKELGITDLVLAVPAYVWKTAAVLIGTNALGAMLYNARARD